LRTGGHGLNDRIDVLSIKLGRSKEINESRAEKGGAVVKKIRFLAPSRQVEIMSPTVVGKGNSVKVKLSHQQTCHAGKNEGPAANRQQSLNETCGHNNAKPDGSPPNGLKFLEQIKVRVRIPGNMFFHECHTHIEASNAVGIVPCFNDAHQVVVHDQRGGLGSTQMLTQREFNHVFALEG
jgi:hypothetical protein